MVLVELSIYPLDKGEHLSDYVARAVKIIKNSGLEYEMHAMGTLIEGEWSEVIKVVDLCYKELEKDCDRIIVSFKADCKKGKSNLIETKVRSVADKVKA
jgi:uncharacterized protein (TIGR00106 family)